MSSLFFLLLRRCFCSSFFFFNDTATTEIYTLSLHDALPIFPIRSWVALSSIRLLGRNFPKSRKSLSSGKDRKSTRLNSSHTVISYAVFCLKKKMKQRQEEHHGEEY